MSFAKNYINGKWYEFNDSWVSEGNYNNAATLLKFTNNFITLLSQQALNFNIHFERNLM